MKYIFQKTTTQYELQALDIYNKIDEYVLVILIILSCLERWSDVMPISFKRLLFISKEWKCIDKVQQNMN